MVNQTKKTVALQSQLELEKLLQFFQDLQVQDTYSAELQKSLSYALPILQKQNKEFPTIADLLEQLNSSSCDEDSINPNIQCNSKIHFSLKQIQTQNFLRECLLD
jgi:hypothetical protein